MVVISRIISNFAYGNIFYILPDAKITTHNPGRCYSCIDNDKHKCA